VRKIISLICFLLPVFAFAAAPEPRENAPDRYVVVKGDTLWDISERFFNDPWKWPEIWGLNKATIKNPHWIYPGDVILLDRMNKRLQVVPGGSAEVVKLSPTVRASESDRAAVPSIPPEAIAAFLSKPLLIEESDLTNAPVILGAPEKRLVLGSGDTAYVRGLSESKGRAWQIYRPGKELRSPDSKELLGREAVYLGDAEVLQFDTVSTVRLTKLVQETGKGDLLMAAPTETMPTYLPHAPEKDVRARIISLHNAVSQAGLNSVITLDKGKRDGLENGHVLALYRKGDTVKESGKSTELPDVRYGLVFIFRTFNKVAYGLVMQTTLPVELYDAARTPR